MKHLFAVCWVLFVCAYAQAQTLSIIDRDTKEPMDLVTLMSVDPEAYATSNMHGQVDLSDFTQCEKIEIRSLGYKTLTLSFSELKKRNFVLELAPYNLNLNEVVISATRWEQSSDNVPSKIVAISPKDVELQNTQTAADLLTLSGKVYLQKSQQGGGSPMIRGFSTNRLLYTIDGIRMNTAIFRGGNLQNVISLDPFATEHTEVLFGPGSVIYGSDAIGGVMSFSTLDAELSLDEKPLITGKANVRYASANQEKTGHFDVGVGWKKWAFVTSFTSWDFDHLRQGAHGPNDYLKPHHVQTIDSMDVVYQQDDELLQVPSAYSQTNLMQKIRFRANDKWDFTYGFHFSETSPYGRYDRHNRTKNDLPKYGEWNYGPQKWMMNNLSIAHTADNKMFDKMHIRLAQQQFEESRIDRGFNSSIQNTNTEQVDAYSINVDFKKNIQNNNSLFYGIEYVLNDVHSTGQITDLAQNTSAAGPARYPESTWQSMAIYVNDEHQLAKNLSIQGGLRYNQFVLDSDFSNNASFYPFPFEKANINNGALTGSLGAVYRPSDTWVINTNFGTAFRAPNVDDIGKVFDSEPGSVTVPNPDLEAEYAYNIDLGAAKVIADAIKIDLTGYYTILENAMVRRDFQLAGQDSIMFQGELSKVQALQNTARAYVYGLQFGLEIKLPDGFSFSTDLNFQKGEEEMANGETGPSRHVAPFFGTSRLNYQMKKLHLQLYSTYQGERSFENLAISERSKDEIYAKDEYGNNYAPAWYTINIKALYKVSEMISLSAGLENITDQRYRPYSSGISAPGRNFILALSAKF